VTLSFDRELTQAWRESRGALESKRKTFFFSLNVLWEQGSLQEVLGRLILVHKEKRAAGHQ
jgi:hypothetical protein